METLICPLKQNAPLRLSASKEFDLAGMQALLGGELTDCAPELSSIRMLSLAENALSEEHQRTGLKYLRREATTGQFHWIREVTGTHVNKVAHWRYLILMGVIQRILQGDKLLIMHGALLEITPGEAIFLCGQSGMGKTTTSRRWMAEGGCCASDDMALVEYGDYGVYAHPLPTWSRCWEKLDGEQRDVTRTLHVQQIVALDRSSADEEFCLMDKRLYQLSVYASACLFPRLLTTNFYNVLRSELSQKIQNASMWIWEHFTHWTLRASLNANLHESLAPILPPIADK